MKGNFPTTNTKKKNTNEISLTFFFYQYTYLSRIVPIVPIVNIIQRWKKKLFLAALRSQLDVVRLNKKKSNFFYIKMMREIDISASCLSLAFWHMLRRRSRMREENYDSCKKNIFRFTVNVCAYIYDWVMDIN